MIVLVSDQNCPKSFEIYVSNAREFANFQISVAFFAACSNISESWEDTW